MIPVKSATENTSKKTVTTVLTLLKVVFFNHLLPSHAPANDDNVAMNRSIPGNELKSDVNSEPYIMSREISIKHARTTPVPIYDSFDNPDFIKNAERRAP